jgi:hypothetical protein
MEDRVLIPVLLLIISDIFSSVCFHGDPWTVCPMPVPTEPAIEPTEAIGRSV